MSKYLVTGGAGFIGSHIVEELVARNQEVVVIDNFSTGYIKNLKPFLDKIKLIEGDIRDQESVTKAMKGIDYVLHQAALASVPRSIDNPEDTNDVNVRGTLNLLMAARDAGVKRFVYAGSSSAYGNCPDLEKHEGIIPAPLSPYAVSKLAGEHYCAAFNHVYGLETVVLRYFNVFGERQDPNSPYAAVIPIFAKLMMQDKPAIINGDGSQTRDFTYVKNNVDANLLACKSAGIAGETFNIACGGQASLLTLIELINKNLGKLILPQFRENRAGDVMHSRANISKAKEKMGYEPKINFEDGLIKTIASFK